MQMSRRRFLSAALALSALPARGGTSVLRLAGPAFGGSWHMVLPGHADLAGVSTAVTAEIEAVDRSMSPYRVGSELTRFNRTHDTGWIRASAALCDTLDEALDVARLSGGAFDPTVGPLVRRFGFGPIAGAGRGDPAGLRVGTLAIRKSDPDLTIDLCGIAKGHAVDRVADAVAALGLSDFLIEIGGEIACRGRHPDGRDWIVAIERPGTLTAAHLLRLEGRALATSGHSANGSPDPWLSHIVDPRLSRPSPTGLASVSVLSASARRADALATALLVLGPEAGPALARAEGIAALFLPDEGSAASEAMTGDFARHIIR